MEIANGSQPIKTKYDAYLVLSTCFLVDVYCLETGFTDI